MVDKLKIFLLVLSTISVDGQQCSGLTGTYTVTADSSSVGDITSYNYPSYYSDYIDCTSTIQNSGSGQILFYVKYQDIEAHYDFLKLYSGSVANTFLYHSDNDYPPFVGLTSDGENLIATFTSDYSVTFGGYKVSFIEVDIYNQASCGSSTAASATAQQLSFVYSTPTAVPCTWTITAPGSSSSVEIVVLLVRGSVKIRENGYDTYFYSAGARYVGQYGTTVQVIGHDNSDFVVEFSSSTENATGAVTPATGTASGSSICGSSSRTSSHKQFLNSPNYPGPYPNNIYCSVVITADDNTESVKVELLDFTTEIYDSLSIIDGTDYSYNPFSPISAGGVYTSTGSSLYLVFQTNDYGQNRGFNLSYMSVEREIPSCVQDYTLDETVTSSTTEETIESPNYPGLYYNYDDRYWLIVKPTESDNIVLDFRVFQVEEAVDCIYDYVDIHDGACTSDPLIIRHCGYNTFTLEEPTGLYILVHFHTDGSITKPGWTLTHYIGQYQDPDADASTDGGSGIPDYVFVIIAIAVILIIASVIFTVLYCKGKGRVGAGEANPYPKRRTTHELMTELSTRLGSADTEKQPKAKRKPNRYHPEPQPPGPNVNIIHRGEWPHPPPGHNDPAYPPAYPPDLMSVGSQMPPTDIAPVFAPGLGIPPSAAPLPATPVPSMIPSPFHYSTPAEARAAGLHG